MSEKRLWRRFSGEPFMVNPPLGILGNPKRRKGRFMATRRRRRGKAYMSWVRSFQKNRRRHRRHRRNPFPVAGVVANPRRRRHYRRNPAFLSGLKLPPVSGVLYVGAGFLGAGAIDHLIHPYLPVDATTGQPSALYTWGARIGSVVGVSLAAGAIFGREKARLAAVGGGAYLLVQAVKQFMPLSFQQQVGLAAYRPMSAYRPLGQPNRGMIHGQRSAGALLANQTTATGSRFRRFN